MTLRPWGLLDYSIFQIRFFHQKCCLLWKLGPGGKPSTLFPPGITRKASTAALSASGWGGLNHILFSRLYFKVCEFHKKITLIPWGLLKVIDFRDPIFSSKKMPFPKTVEGCSIMRFSRSDFFIKQYAFSENLSSLARRAQRSWEAETPQKVPQ